MFVKSFLLLCVLYLSEFECSPSEFVFNALADGWLKLHSTPAIWSDAKVHCDSEGAVLASPLNRQLRDAIKQYLLQKFKHSISLTIFTGLQADYATGDFLSIEGYHLLDLPVTLEQGTFVNFQSSESCITWNTGKDNLKKDKCDRKLPYVCYKRVESSLTIPIKSSDLKVKPTPLNITTTKQQTNLRQEPVKCVADGTYLIVIKSELEFSILENLAKNPANQITITFADNLEINTFQQFPRNETNQPIFDGKTPAFNVGTLSQFDQQLSQSQQPTNIQFIGYGLTNTENGTPYPTNGAPNTGNGTPYPANGTLNTGNSAQYPANGAPNTGNGQPYPVYGTPNTGNGTPYPRNGTPNTGNSAQYPANGAPNSGNGQPYPVNGTLNTGNGTPYLRNGTPNTGNSAQYPANGAPNTGNGQPYPVNGTPNAGNGTTNTGNGTPYPRNDTPNTGNSAQYPANGAPNTGNGQPYPVNGTPNTGNGTPYPRNGTPKTGSGTPDPVNRTPNAGNGTTNTGNGTPYPRNDTPNTGNSAQYPASGAPNTGNGQPYPANGTPNTGNGTPYPRNGTPKTGSGTPDPVNGTPNTGIGTFNTWHGKPGTEVDYTLVTKAGGWLKIHGPATWSNARDRCNFEGGVLVSPLTSELRDGIKQYVLSMNPSISTIHTGVHANFNSGDYFSIEGVFLMKMPVTLSHDVFIDYSGSESCISMTTDGSTQVQPTKCTDKLPYVCYKKEHAVNACGTPDPEYKYEAQTKSCYKFHRIGETWTNAYTKCKDEGGYLAIINSQAESNVLKHLFAKNPKKVIKGYYYYMAYLGVRDWLDGKSWTTVQGQSLSQTGYVKWASTEPNNARKDENCLTFHRKGVMYDDPCDLELAFICEKTPETLVGDPPMSQL